MDTTHKLSFQALDERIDQYVRQQKQRDMAGPVERWALCIGLLGASAGMLSGALMPDALGLRLLRIGLAVEVIGLGVAAWLMLGREWKSFVHAQRVYAGELDADYRYFKRVVGWLKRFPAADLRRRQRFVELCRSSIGYRMGLVTGGLERLGLIPVMVALYLQLKDWRFGDWEALGRVNLLGGLLLGALCLVYVVSWRGVSLKTRLDTYDALLKEAVAESD
jgi:hypothetical protein